MRRQDKKGSCISRNCLSAANWGKSTEKNTTCWKRVVRIYRAITKEWIMAYDLANSYSYQQLKTSLLLCWIPRQNEPQILLEGLHNQYHFLLQWGYAKFFSSSCEMRHGLGAQDYFLTKQNTQITSYTQRLPHSRVQFYQENRKIKSQWHFFHLQQWKWGEPFP